MADDSQNDPTQLTDAQLMAMLAPPQDAPQPTSLSFPQQDPPPVPDTSALPDTQQPIQPLQGNPQPAQQQTPSVRPLLFDLISQLRYPPRPTVDSSGVQGPPISRASIVENFLGNFIGALGAGFGAAHGPGAFGKGFSAAVGEPLARQQQMQQFASQQSQQAAETAALQQRTQLASTSIPITLPDGRTMYVPASQAGTVLGNVYKGSVAAQTNAQAKRYMNVPGAGLVDTQADGGPKVVVAKQNGGVEITSDLAAQFNIPKQFIGSDIKLTDLAAFEKAGNSTTIKATKDPVTGLVTVSSSTTTRGTGTPSGFGPPSSAPSRIPKPSTGPVATPATATKWDPSSIPVKLATGEMDPSQLPKRGANYSYFLQKADEYSRQVLGKPFDIGQASIDYNFARNPQTQNVLKYLDSLTGHDNKSGNLGALVDMSNKISRTDFPALNNIGAWAKLQTGDPQMAGYYTAVTEVADQVGKILQGGGSGAGTSDAKLRQAQEMFNTGFSKDQITNVAGTLRTLLANRKSELIGSNTYLQRQYQNKPASTGNSAVDRLVTKYAR